MTWKFALIATAAFAPALAGELRAGRAAVKITPPSGMPMAGYYYVRLNEGVHDDLYAKAVVLEKDGVKAAVVALDMANIPRRFVEAARSQIGQSTGVPAYLADDAILCVVKGTGIALDNLDSYKKSILASK